MIRELKIKNFKCFLDKKIQFNQLTLFAGTNAVGKSSVIQSLLIIRQTLEKISVNPLIQHNILLNGEYCLKLGNSSEVLSSTADNEQIELLVNVENRYINFEYSASRADPDLYIKYINEDQYHIERLRDYGSIFNREFYYLNAERIGPRVLHEMVDQEFPHTGFQGEYVGYILSKHTKHKVEEKRRFVSKDLTVPDLNKQVEYWMDYIIPGIELNATPYQNINVVEMTYRRKFSETVFLNPNNMGFGISYVLPIIVNGLIATKGSIFIVENPEAHLHPSGQARIGQFLAQVASSGIQVIIETHSEHVINGIRIACLKDIINHNDVGINFFNIDNTLRNVDIDHLVLNEYAELSNWPKGFLDQEQQDIRELISLRRGMAKKK